MIVLALKIIYNIQLKFLFDRIRIIFRLISYMGYFQKKSIFQSTFFFKTFLFKTYFKLCISKQQILKYLKTWQVFIFFQCRRLEKKSELINLKKMSVL